MTDDNTAQRIEAGFKSRIVDAIAWHKRSVVIPVVEVFARVEVDRAEWMYELEQAASGMKYDSYIRLLSLHIIFQRWDLATAVTCDTRRAHAAPSKSVAVRPQGGCVQAAGPPLRPHGL